MWDAQLKTLKRVKHVGMVVTTDLAIVTEPNPKNKQEVGRRLANIAACNVYRQRLPEDKRPQVCSGPVFESMEINGQKIRLTFQNADGLKARSALSLRA